MPDRREMQFWSVAQAAAFTMRGHPCRIELQPSPTKALRPLFIFGPEVLGDWQSLREEISRLQRTVGEEIAKRRRQEQRS
jgi:hypothetical protein